MLWIVATPIGTLDDLSPRAREVLRSADLIASEDTRVTRRLLSAVDIPSPQLVALHAHNEEAISQRLAEDARERSVALVCDAGTPGISDPGTALVAACHRLGVEVRSVPGPSALAGALAASGLPAIPSTFLGFPPRKGRDGWVRAALAVPHTVVCYEAPTRVAELISLFAAHAPDREAVLCREISKRYEEIVRRPLPLLAADLGGRDEVLGECVLVVGPGQPLRAAVAEAEAGDGLKKIAELLAQRWGRPRRVVYEQLLALGDADDGGA
jgi:16S rRNA (cytidine1402-2'-O)-methyltransferase